MGYLRLNKSRNKKRLLALKSNIQRLWSMENLHGDLLLNIFIRLLAKQLAQMRCVSKYWNALLSQSSFVKSHLHHSINNNDRILLFYNEAASSDDYDDDPEHTNFLKFPIHNGYTTSVKVIGSVHGLICYSDDNIDAIHIWNPSLSAVSTLPPYFVSSRGSYDLMFRFGFDPKDDDYKVFKLIGLTGPPRRQSGNLTYIIKEWLQVEVYSMRKGSWNFITQRFPSHVTRILKHDALCVDGHDGHLHFHGYIDDEEGEIETIVAFDLGSETFREIPLPDFVLDNNRENSLGVLGGKLCVMSWYDNDDEYEGLQVWVMDEYGVAESWVKHHVRSPFSVGVVYGFTSHKVFLIVDDDSQLVFYDPTSHKKNILRKFRIRKRGANGIIEYVDSLVWVAPKGMVHDKIEIE